MSLSAQIRRIEPAGLELSGKSVFLHKDQKIVATGEAVRISAKGGNRISELSAAWQEILRTADISNNSSVEDAGLIGLVSIA